MDKSTLMKSGRTASREDVYKRQAELIDHLHILRNNGGSAVEHDGEARQAVGDLLQDLEPELGLLAGLEFISAVAGADRDGQDVYKRQGR